MFKELEPGALAKLPSLRSVKGKLSRDEAPRIVTYLRNGEVVADAMEIVRDPLNPGFVIRGGSGLQSDGAWVWRQDLAHFVESYHVDLPTDFLTHVSEVVTPRVLTRAEILRAIADWNQALRDPG